MSVEGDLSGTADATVRVPANMMAMIRRSYDTREKVLDWILALSVVLALVFFFQDELWAMVSPDPSPDAGRNPQPQPNQDASAAFPLGGYGSDRITYNLPGTRIMVYGKPPSSTAPPRNPYLPPVYNPPTGPTS